MKQIVTLTVFAVVLALGSVALAQESPHYVNGVEGIKAATLPPPGLYFRLYGVGYHATTMKNKSRNRVHMDFDVTVAAAVPRVVWISNTKFLGADLGMDAFIPVIHTNIDITPGPVAVRDAETGFGDVWIEPLLLSWHEKWYDASIGLGFFAPTGQNSVRRAASPGKDHWTFMPTAGVTVYLDEEKTVSASILARYEVHSTKRDRPIHAGDDFHFEWGLAKSIMPGIDVGVAGYCQWQITDDDGAGVVWNGTRHDRIFGAGPEISTFFPHLGLGVSFRVLKEFAVANAAQGCTAVLTITKAF